jgi:hypothetical protein
VTAARDSKWTMHVRGDPLTWLLDEAAPAVRHQALLWLLDRPPEDTEVVAAQQAAMTADPIATILAAQHESGYWEKPGPGYATKYRGTVWQLIFLDQLGADPADARVRTACEYVLAHGFWVVERSARQAGDRMGGTGYHRYPAHRLLRLGHDRTRLCLRRQRRPAVRLGSDQSGAGAGQGSLRGAVATGPEGDPAGIAFLLSCDPATAVYPMGYGNTKPSSLWFKLGFPSGYVADVLQNFEVLGELGYASDPRLRHSLEWLIGKQDAHGRWHNEYAYNGKTWVDFEHQGQPSKWVTLRACHVLKLAFG